MSIESAPTVGALRRAAERIASDEEYCRRIGAEGAGRVYQREMARLLAQADPATVEAFDELAGEPRRDIFIDWETFWATDHSAEEWLAYPLIPAHRQVAIYAPAKSGKSLLALDISLSLATGRPILGGDRVEPVHVMYLDYEMTEDDLKERMVDLGYSEDDDLSRFHYALQPPFPPLDTVLGGEAAAAHAAAVGAQAVVVDTFGRAVQGDENEADTVRNFYRCTGMELKRDGRALVRTDHSGKDLEKGQRGTSAKNDDVDVVWQVTRAEDGLTLRRTFSRVRWVPETVAVTIEQAPVLRHVALGNHRMYVAGTKECVELLEQLGVPVEMSARKAEKALREAGHGTRGKVVRDAVRFRFEEAKRTLLPVDNSVDKWWDAPRDAPKTDTRPDSWDAVGKEQVAASGRSRDAGGRAQVSGASRPPLYRADADADRVPHDPDDHPAADNPNGAA